jgi:N-acetylmuramoyl-L-alanine amidase
MLKRLFFSWLLIICAALPAAAAMPEIDISEESGRASIVISGLEAGDAKVFLLAGPDRLVADIPAVAMTAAERNAVTLPSSYDGALIKDVRCGKPDPATLRFVFDLKNPVRIVRAAGESDQLTVEISSAKEDRKEKNYTRTKKSGKPLIVIDPGHGGIDPGTIARDGLQEKRVTLAYARALRAALIDTGDYDVILTRTDDRFIVLRDRFAIARKKNADLFISLHADSAPDDVRGLSVYTVSEKASDQEADALAQRENKSDVLADMDLSDEREDVAGILISLVQRETNNRSAMFADLLVANLTNRVSMLERAHRFAGFAVLKAPDVPSVLIELGFLSHHADEKLLKSKAYRDHLIDGIVAGVDAYFRNKQRLERG